MSFNWTTSQAEVTKLLKTLGFQVSVTRVVDGVDQGTLKAWAVWDTNTKQDLAEGASRLNGNRKQMYVGGTLKVAPAPGDLIKQGQDVWSVLEVEAYKPVKTVLAYRVVVQ